MINEDYVTGLGIANCALIRVYKKGLIIEFDEFYQKGTIFKRHVNNNDMVTIVLRDKYDNTDFFHYENGEIDRAFRKNGESKQVPGDLSHYNFHIDLIELLKKEKIAPEIMDDIKTIKKTSLDAVLEYISRKKFEDLK